MKKLVILFFIAFTIVSCENKVGLPPVTAAPAPTPDACDTITYTKHIQTILSNNCTSCHNSLSASGGIDLSSYTLAKNKALDGRIKVRAIDNSDITKGPMPPSGVISQAERDLLQCWINNGAKQN